MTVAELIEALEDKDANAEVYISLGGAMYPTSDIKNVLNWRKQPTGTVIIVSD